MSTIFKLEILSFWFVSSILWPNIFFHNHFEVAVYQQVACSTCNTEIHSYYRISWIFWSNKTFLKTNFLCFRLNICESYLNKYIILSCRSHMFYSAICPFWLRMSFYYAIRMFFFSLSLIGFTLFYIFFVYEFWLIIQALRSTVQRYLAGSSIWKFSFTMLRGIFLFSIIPIHF